MLIPNYWVRHTIEFPHQTSKHSKKISRIQRFGWSNTSIEEARQHAQERCELARQNLQNPEKRLERRSQSKIFNMLEGNKNYDETPIREQIVQNYPELDCILTINSYGANCLNIADVMVLDIDNDDLFKEYGNDFTTAQPMYPSFNWVFILPSLLLPLIVGCGIYFSSNLLITLGILIPLIVLFIGMTVNENIYQKRSEEWQTQKQNWIDSKGGYNTWVEESLDKVLAQRKHLTFNLYQTPLGFRIITLQNTYTPNDTEMLWLCNNLPVDESYVNLCKIQQCFRARVTGKPWRMRIKDKPYRHFWLANQIDNSPKIIKDLEQRAQWIKEYNKTALSYRACKFIKRIGNIDTPIDPKVSGVVSLHDQLCQSNKDLPLA